MNVKLQEAKDQGDWKKWCALMEDAGLLTNKLLEQAFTLAAFYNHSRPQGLGVLQANIKDILSPEEAAAILYYHNGTYFDYFRGRVLKIDVGNLENLSHRLYDRDLGIGAGERALKCQGCASCSKQTSSSV